jgi:ribosomal protein L29
VLFIKIRDIRQQSDGVLNSMIGQLSLELSIEKRKIASTGVSSKIVKNHEIRRTIARINTVLKERGAKV